MFCTWIAIVLAGRTLKIRNKSSVTVGLGAVVALACATHRPPHHRPYAAGAAGMAGFTSSGGAGAAGVGGRGAQGGGRAFDGNSGEGGGANDGDESAGAGDASGGRPAGAWGETGGRGSSPGGGAGTEAMTVAGGGAAGSSSIGGETANGGGGAGGASNCGPCMGGYVCSGGACKTSCVSDDDCVSDHFCSGGACKVDAIQVSISSTHACILLADKTVRCWGQNDDGELGTVSASDASTPQPVQGIANVKVVAASLSQSVALLNDGTVYFWGKRATDYNALTSAITYTTAVTPTELPYVATAKDLAASNENDRACVLMNDNTVRCWGFDTASDGSTAFRAIPTTISGLSDVSLISMGTGFTCVEFSSGGVDCWGHGTESELGTISNFSDTPVEVSGLSDSALRISCGHYFTCALLLDGAVQCWGANGYGQLGADAPGGLSSGVPNTINGLSLVKDLSAGESHACAVDTSGGVRCWGDDSFAQLGDDLQNDGSTSPISVRGLASAVQSVATGFFNTCAVLQNGSVQCWGRSIGDLSSAPTAAPTTVW